MPPRMRRCRTQGGQLRYARRGDDAVGGGRWGGDRCRGHDARASHPPSPRCREVGVPARGAAALPLAHRRIALNRATRHRLDRGPLPAHQRRHRPVRAHLLGGRACGGWRLRSSQPLPCRRLHRDVGRRRRGLPSHRRCAHRHAPEEGERCRRVRAGHPGGMAAHPRAQRRALRAGPKGPVLITGGTPASADGTDQRAAAHAHRRPIRDPS